ncbi:substrate-binding domain-containing protein [Labrys wisconsinensis]|uniref:Ribose transport system substrate-binding protein n=1 Tax=Labrys wisconsinensis TaxID=425677 RepID=A0ABU0J6P4_9HYPH|nr:substrate-binding domain-containing protein [Labrys wisconsinensis]MDQ0469932.1 ribose transport system substrate-binding protein [Labrys wisconsinensis]
MTDKIEWNRRGLLAALAAAGAGASLLPLAAGPAAAEASDADYVFLSIVTQVPFWVDHRAGLEAAAAALGVKTSFTGPLDFDTAGQARQLDELIARKPAGLLIFPGDAAALAPGIDRAVEAGIPVACIIGDVAGTKRAAFLGISNYEAGRIGGEMLAEAVGGKGKVLLGTFPAPSTLERVKGYKDVLAEKFPEIQVVDVVNDKADPSYAPTAYAQALQAHPDVVGIGGTDGDSGKGAALAVVEQGKVGAVKIVAMDRNTDMLPYIADGTIHGSVAQKSWLESYLAVHLLHWLNQNKIHIVADSAKAGINPLPDTISTGVMRVTKDNVSAFMPA